MHRPNITFMTHCIKGDVIVPACVYSIWYILSAIRVEWRAVRQQPHFPDPAWGVLISFCFKKCSEALPFCLRIHISSASFPALFGFVDFFVGCQHVALHILFCCVRPVIPLIWLMSRRRQIPATTFRTLDYYIEINRPITKPQRKKNKLGVGEYLSALVPHVSSNKARSTGACGFSSL